ncbi:MAG: 3-dehydroquinate synthase II [Candidatus Aenigmatarchaeota archaeon]
MILRLSTAEIIGIKEIENMVLSRIKLDCGNPYLPIGCFSRALFLVPNEMPAVISNYVLSSENSTCYFSDLRKGSKILSVDGYGEAATSTVEENIILRGPSLLVKARCNDLHNDDYSHFYKRNEINVFIQDSEKSGLVGENEKLIGANRLDDSDLVKVFIGLKEYGTHFGSCVEDIRLIEK